MNFFKISQKVYRKLTNHYVFTPISPAELKNQSTYNFEFAPKISIVVPMYKTDPKFFQQLVSSIETQSYSNWELCFADGSPEQDEALKSVIKSITEGDSRIKYLYRGYEKNIGIAANTNAAIKFSTGDFVAFMDHDDLLPKNALFEVVKAINDNKTVDFIYTDEDHISNSGKHFLPHFKPDFSKYELLSRNYISHFTVIKRTLLAKTGELNSDFDGAQDYDLILRASRKAQSIIHIPKVLYHWRSHRASTASGKNAKPWAFSAGQQALESFLKSEKIAATVSESGKVPGVYDLDFKLRKQIPELVLISYGDLAREDLEALAALASRNDVGVVGGKVINKNGTIYAAGAVYNERGEVFGKFAGLGADELGYLGKLQTLQNVSILPSACLVVRKEILKTCAIYQTNRIVFENAERTSRHISGSNILYVNSSLLKETEISDFCLEILQKGYNNIYTPKVELQLKENLKFHSKISKTGVKDPFYNENFKQTNGKYEIRNRSHHSTFLF